MTRPAWTRATARRPNVPVVQKVVVRSESGAAWEGGMRVCWCRRPRVGARMKGREGRVRGAKAQVVVVRVGRPRSQTSLVARGRGFGGGC